MIPLLSALLLLAAPPLQDTAHVVVVATTDVHGHATGWNYVTNRPSGGGLARVAAIVDSLKTRYPGQVVLVDAGDLIQGDPFATYFARVAPRDPNPLIEAMSLSGYDVATPGNHEFDWGLKVLRQVIAGAAFPYVSGNIYSLAGDTLLFPPYVVLQRQGVRVGITGFTTPGVMVWDRDHLKGKLRVDPIPQAAARVMGALRRESDLTVALVHSGLDGPSSYDTTGVGAENVAASLASLAARPDLVIVGHTHREMADSVLGGVHFVQPKPYTGSVSVTHLDLVREEQGWRKLRIRSELISTTRTPPLPRLVQRLEPAHAAVLEWVDTPLGSATRPMYAAAARAEPTAVLDFINAVQLKRTGAGLSAATAFDLKAGFDSGTIRLGQVLGLYPFDNTLRAVRISGLQLKNYLEHSARYFQVDPIGRVSINDSVPGYNYDVIAGARYEIDLRLPIGDRIRNLAVRGRPVVSTDSFTLAVNSYRQTGAGGYTMLPGAPVVYDKGENIRELLADEIRSEKVIDPAGYPASQWRIVPEPTAAAVRALFGVPGKPEPRSPRDTVVLRILATSDLRGALLPRAGEPGGRMSAGVAAIAGLMDRLEAECGCPTLRLDAGDAMQGTVTSNITSGRAMVEVLNRVNISAAALGEHDLAWSRDTLRRRMSEARYPWLAANVFDSVGGRRPDWIVPYRIVRAGGLRIAVIGYITADTKTSTNAGLSAGLRFGEGALAIHDVLTEVRALQPDLTIVLAHAGATCVGAVCAGEVIRLAEAVESHSLDLLIAGHNHQDVNTRVANVPVIGAAYERSALAVADVVRTPAGGVELRTRIEPVDLATVRADPDIAALVEAYRRRVDSITSRVVLTVKLPLGRVRDQFGLGNLIAEARRNVLRADVGLVGNDGIRADLPAGPVTYRQLLDIQPSQHELVRLTLTGAQLREVFTHALERSGRPAAHVAGATVRYDPRRPARKRVQSVELWGGRKLRSNARYTLAADDYLAAGGKGYTMLINLPSEPSALLDVDGLLAYLRRLPRPVEVTDRPGFVAIRR